MIDEAIQELRYVDYSLLSRLTREKAATARARAVDALNPDEGDIGPIEWLAISKAVEKKTREHHGAARSDPLKVHHRNVLKIGRVYDWGTARIYDERTRELMASDTRHDPSIVHQDLVTQAIIFRRMEKTKTDLLSQHSQHLRPPTSSYPSSVSPQNVVSPLAPPLANITGVSSPARRFNPYDQSGRPPKSTQPDLKCFRCGVTGHLSSECGAKSTASLA